jgi:hypothetical protein
MRSLVRFYMNMTEPLTLVGLVVFLLGVVLLLVFIGSRRRGEAGMGCLLPAGFIVGGLLIVFRWEVLSFLF